MRKIRTSGSVGGRPRKGACLPDRFPSDRGVLGFQAVDHDGAVGGGGVGGEIAGIRDDQLSDAAKGQDRLADVGMVKYYAGIREGIYVIRHADTPLQ